VSIPVSALDNLLELGTPEDEIKWRAGQRQHEPPCDKPMCRQPHAQLAYVDARYVMRVLDSTLVGPGNWQRVHAIGPDGKVACGIGILVDYEDGQPPQWVWKWDGAGETDIEGEKGSFSDAFKRAAVSWGVARDLYSMKPQSSGQSAPRAATPPAPPSRVEGRDLQSVGGAGSDLTAGLDEELHEGECPDHHLVWVLKPAGVSKAGKEYPAFWKCPKQGQPYCNNRPSKAWQARHEVAA
jgi:hypothetical protein